MAETASTRDQPSEPFSLNNQHIIAPRAFRSDLFSMVILARSSNDVTGLWWKLREVHSLNIFVFRNHFFPFASLTICTRTAVSAETTSNKPPGGVR